MTPSDLDATLEEIIEKQDRAVIDDALARLQDQVTRDLLPELLDPDAAEALAAESEPRLSEWAGLQCLFEGMKRGVDEYEETRQRFYPKTRQKEFDRKIAAAKYLQDVSAIRETVTEEGTTQALVRAVNLLGEYGLGYTIVGWEREQERRRGGKEAARHALSDKLSKPEYAWLSGLSIPEIKEKLVEEANALPMDWPKTRKARKLAPKFPYAASSIAKWI